MSQGYNNWGYNCDCQNEKKEYLPKHCDCCHKCCEKKEEPKQKCATIKVCVEDDKKDYKKDNYGC